MNLVINLYNTISNIFIHLHTHIYIPHIHELIHKYIILSLIFLIIEPKFKLEFDTFVK